MKSRATMCICLATLITIMSVVIVLTLLRYHTNAQASGKLSTGPVNTTWYFGDGRVGNGFEEFLTLNNPDPANACSVNVQYFYAPDGGTTSTKTVTLTVAAYSRYTENVNLDLNVPASQTPGVWTSAIITVNTNVTPVCSGIVAERVLPFDHSGVNSETYVLGATHLGTNFYFADVANGGGFSSHFSILNPPSNSTATVTVNYYLGGQSVGSQKRIVASGSRITILPSNVSNLPQHVAAVITSTQPIVAERSTYFKQVSEGNAGIVSGAAAVIGSQSLAKDWLFAEGYTGGQFQEYLVLANVATTTAIANVKLEYANGGTQTVPVSIPAKDQAILDVNQLNANPIGTCNPNPCQTTAVTSAEITSNIGIVAQREIFFHYANNGITAMGGTDVIGLVGPKASTSYSFDEGYTNTNWSEWLTLQNLTANTETINVTLVNGLSRTYTQQVTVAAHSRITMNIDALVQQYLVQPGDSYLAYEVWMTVQASTVGAYFIPERVMDWNVGAGIGPEQGGSDVFGYDGK